MLGRIRASLRACAGDVVFGMEDGTVSIFGLVFGVAASTSDPRVVLVAGCSGCCAAAVSMMAGVYLEAQTQADQGAQTAHPIVRALWMLLSDFFAAAVPVAPFVFLPVAEARWLSAAITLSLLAALGAGRAKLGCRPPFRTIVETMTVGLMAAVAGLGVGSAFAHALS